MTDLGGRTNDASCSTLNAGRQADDCDESQHNECLSNATYGTRSSVVNCTNAANGTHHSETSDEEDADDDENDNGREEDEHADTSDEEDADDDENDNGREEDEHAEGCTESLQGGDSDMTYEQEPVKDYDIISRANEVYKEPR